jgi:hypothetical protein
MLCWGWRRWCGNCGRCNVATTKWRGRHKWQWRHGICLGHYRGQRRICCWRRRGVLENSI